MLEEIDEVKKKKKRIDAEIKSLNDTADELCTKAEATAKLTFVIQANALRRSAKDKLNDLVSLDQNFKFHAKKAEGIILYNLIVWLYDIICTYRNCFFGVTVEKM